MAVDDDAPESLNPSDIPPATTSAGDEDASAAIEVPVEPAASYLRAAVLVGLSAVVALAGLGAWLGSQVYQSHQSSAERNLSVQVARQGALNLTTIDYEHAEADIQRILDSATGAFYDDFSKRSQPFIEVVKKAQAKSTGTVTEAGIESETDAGAEILVSVNVETINAGSTEQTSRAWRMRISVSESDGQRKVANVAFVP